MPLFLVAAVVCAVQREVAQGGGLGLDPVQPRAVGRRVGEFDVGLGPVAYPGVLLGGQVRGEVGQHDRDADLGRVEAAQVAAELQEPRAVLPRLDVAVELVLAQVVGGEQVPDPVWAGGPGVGHPSAGPGLPVGVLVSAATLGPLLPGVGLEVERAELVHAEDDFGFAFLGYDHAVGDGVEVLDTGLLGGVVRVAGGLPGLCALT